MIREKKPSIPALAAMLVCGCSAISSANDLPALKNLYKDSFLVGGAFNRNLVMNRDPKAAETAIQQYNSATPENDMKWSEIHPKLDTYNWKPADAFVDFATQNQMVPIGHCLVWHSQVPRWVFCDDEGKDLSRDELLGRMKDHIEQVVGRYKGRIKGWDVVNEALNKDGTLHDSPWLKIIGEGKEEQKYDHIVKAFEYAHAADPEAELYYNDFDLDTSKEKCDAAIEIVKHLQSKGLRIDGVGIQLHAGLTHPSKESLEYAINSIKQLGIKVMISELDIRTELEEARNADAGDANRSPSSDNDATSEETQEKLAQKYAELFRIFVAHKDDISRVTFWGVYDSTSWIGGSPLLFDKNFKPKKAFHSVVDVIQKSGD